MIQNVTQGLGLLKEMGCEDVEWIHLAHVMVQWWGFVHTVMKARVP